LKRKKERKKKTRYLYNNQLFGTIPTHLGKLTSLREL